MSKSFKFIGSAIIAFLFSSSAMSATPDSYDGLVLAPESTFGKVYKKPGVDLSTYTEFSLSSCEVSFRKNWLRDQNRGSIDLSDRVTQQDVTRIRNSLSSSCSQFFRSALEEAPAYNLVNDSNDGQAVLIIKPSIINLDVNAPDVRSAQRITTYTTSWGAMTLVLELVDGTTHEVLARVVDETSGHETNFLQWSNSVSNKIEEERELKRWAAQLRKALDSASL